MFHRSGEPIKSYYHAWRSAVTRAATVKHEDGTVVVARPQLIGRIVHDFRRTAVRNLVRAGVPERVAMSLTGHKTRTIFDRYHIVNEADLSDGIERLAKSFEPKKGRQARRQKSEQAQAAARTTTEPLQFWVSR